MTQTLEQLAKLTDSSFIGDKSVEIRSVATLADATTGQISFVSNPKYISQLATSTASAIILNPKLAEDFTGNALINEDPYRTFAQVLRILHTEQKRKATVHKTAVIDPSAKVDQSVTIGPNVVVEADAKIEKNVVINAGCFIGTGSHIDQGSRLYPNATIYDKTRIGKNTIIHSGVVLGADGFGFAPTQEKEWYKILQIGNVVIGDDVEIGANSTVDCAALGTTLIGNGVKLDNQIHIGHNVVIGDHSIIAGGTVVAGSTNIGKHCQIGGAVAISGHLTIADDVVITGKSMVIKSIKSAGVYSSGIAADDNKKWRRNAARFRKLDEMAKNINRIDKKLQEK